MGDARRRTDHLADETEPLLTVLLTRRRFLQGVLSAGAAVSLTGLLAACGGDDGDIGSDESTATPADDASDSTATDEPEEDEPTPTEEEMANGETRTFVDDEGRSIEIPLYPTRIVATNDGNILPGLLELGALDRIAGSAHGIDDGEPVFRANPEIDVDTSTITLVGEYGELDLEKVAEVNPDLIVSFAGTDPDVLSLYSEIAPTVMVQTFGVPISHTIGRFAEILGAEDQLQELEAVYQAALQEARDKVGGDPTDVVLSMITTGAYADPGTIYTQDNWSALQQTLKDIGFARPALQLEDDERNVLSFEQVITQDGDLLLLLSYHDGSMTSEEAASELTSSPLWSQLNAIQKDQVDLIPWEEFGGVSYGGRTAFATWVAGVVEGVDTSGDLSHVDIAVPEDNSAGGDTPASATRMFVDDLGREVEVPVTPQRIIALHDTNGGTQALSLGAPVVGLAHFWPWDEPPGVITRHYDLEGIAGIGWWEEIDIEKVATLEPDLIIAYTSDDGVIFPAPLQEAGVEERLASVAPIVAIHTFRPVKEVMATFTDLLGIDEAVLQQQEADFEAALEEVRDALDGDWQDVTAGYMHVRPDTIDAWGPTSLPVGDIVTRLGATWFALGLEAEAEGGVIAQMSLERIEEFECDLLLYSNNRNDLRGNPLFDALQVAQEEQLVPMPDPFFGPTYDNYIAAAEHIAEAVRGMTPFNFKIIQE